MHAIVERMDDVDHTRRDSETGGKFPPERTVDGVVRLVQIDEARVQWDSARSTQLVQSAYEKHDARGLLAPKSALFLREDPCFLAKTIKPVGYNDNDISSMSHEGDAPVVTILDPYPCVTLTYISNQRGGGGTEYNRKADTRHLNPC